MVPYPQATRLSLPVAPCAAVLAFGAVTLACLSVPQAMLDSGVEASGIPALLGAAEPPLGVTARTVLALGGGGGIAAVLWAALFLLVGPLAVTIRLPRARVRQADGVPAVRRADAHPDAPPRRPLSAVADLGMAQDGLALITPGEQPVPRDLDMPLAAFDPHAIPDQPRQPIRPVAPLARAVALGPGERLDTFVLVPPMPKREPTASVEALLDRLERTGRRPARAPASLDDTLHALRRLATRTSELTGRPGGIGAA